MLYHRVRLQQLRLLGSVNVVEGEPNDRQMTTGNHTVRDIYCVKCATILGWKYVCIHLSLLQAVSCSCYRIEHMNLPRNTRRENISSSVISSSTFNERCHAGVHTPVHMHFDDGLTARVDLDNSMFKFSPRSSSTTHCDKLTCHPNWVYVSVELAASPYEARSHHETGAL